jgi:MscS family membrane protein
MQLPTVMTSPVALGSAWVLGGMLAAGAAVWLTRLLEHASKKAKIAVAEALFLRLRIPIAIILVLLGIQGSLVRFGVSQQWVYKLFISLLIVVAAYGVIAIAATLIRFWLQFLVRKTKTRADDNFLSISQGFFKLLVLILAFALVLASWGVHIGPLIAGLGIAGLAVGLALQNTMANVIGGIALILDETFNVGDVIQLETGEIGQVMHIGLRSTKVLTEDSQLLVLPNGVLANQKLINYALPNSHVRIIIDVGVAYGTNVRKAENVILGAIRGIEGVLADPAPVVHFKNMGDFSLNFQLKFFIRDYGMRHELKSIATQRMYDALNKAKINIPFPTRTVYLKR